MQTLGFLQNMSPMEMLLILGIALLLFGRRLPEVGRSLGKGIVEFKKGLKGIDDDIETQSSQRRTENNPYRQQLTSGEAGGSMGTGGGMDDRRVSRADPVEKPSPAEPAGH